MGVGLFPAGLSDLPVAGVFIGDGGFWKFDDAEVAEAAQTFLVLGHTGGKIRSIHLADTN